MKKIGIVILAGLVLAGCIFAAGCTATGDPVVGVWKLTEPTELGTQESEGYDVYETFLSEGTGIEKFYKEGEKYDSSETSTTYISGSSSSSSTFSWTKVNETTYNLVYPLEGTITATYDAAKNTLTTKWGVFTKYI